MRTILRLAYLPFLALVMFVISCQTASKTTSVKLLKFNLEKNKGYDYDITWDLTNRVMGQDSKIQMEGNYSLNVTDDDGLVKTIEMMYKRIKMKMNVMGMTLESDSEQTGEPDNNQTDNKDSLSKEKNPMVMMDNAMSTMNKMMHAMTGKPFSLKVDLEGNILEIKGFDKILGDMMDSMDIDPEAKLKALASVQDQFGEGELKSQFAQIFTLFPNKKVEVGDTWEKSYTLGGNMKARFTTKYTVKEIDGDYVTLTSATKIEPTDENFQLKGEQTGNIIVDSRTGLVVNAEFEQKLNGTNRGTELSITGKGKIKGTAK